MFIGSIIVNFVLMGLAIAFVVHPPGWIKEFPFIGKEITLLRALAISALIGIPGAVLIRNRRRALVAGNSVMLSRTQFPEIRTIENRSTSSVMRLPTSLERFASTTPRGGMTCC